MTIMFAGGMTIAIPGETPVAIAQTGMLSVSATAAPGNSFGGPQVIQIVVDDPSRSEIGTNISSPDVTVDGTGVTMTQADTGKWYAYVASVDISLASTPLTPLIGAIDATTDIAIAEPTFLDDTPESSETGANPIRDIRIFDFDGDVEIALGSESITLNYDQDLDSLATVSTDRTGVPVNGQVHVTVSDFRLNLDPTTSDVWFMRANGSLATYVDTFADDSPDWSVVFIGDDNDAGVFKIDNLERAVIADADPDTAPDLTNIVRFEETGANTGVFESQNGDISNIVATGDENDDFTIDYAGNSVQVFIEDFDSTLETIADGTWNSGDTITVRLTNENLNTNTLTDQDMEIDDPNLPVLIQGKPITLYTVELERVGDAAFGEEWSVNPDTHVATLRATNTTTTFTVTLQQESDNNQLARLLDGTLSSYIHYPSSNGFTATTNAQLNITGLTDVTADAIDVVDGQKLNVLDDANGIFNITFTAAITEQQVTDNENIGTAVTTAETEAEAIDEATAGTVKSAATGGPSTFSDAINLIEITNATIDDVLAQIREAADDSLFAVDGTIVADIFTFGENDNGDTENHAIYRALLAETDSGSGVFEGTVEYQMLNQRTVNLQSTHDNVVAVSDELVMILDKDYTGTDAPEVTYVEDNASEDAPTNTGEVSVDAATYRVADDVTITLTDLDLNTDSEAREIYRIVDSDGNTEMPALASVEIGSLNCEAEITSVSLRETADDSGVFEGSFEVQTHVTTN